MDRIITINPNLNENFKLHKYLQEHIQEKKDEITSKIYRYKIIRYGTDTLNYVSLLGITITSGSATIMTLIKNYLPYITVSLSTLSIVITGLKKYIVQATKQYYILQSIFKELEQLELDLVDDNIKINDVKFKFNEILNKLNNTSISNIPDDD